MNKLANDKGITLIALVVTIIVLLILASITVPAGRDVIANAKLTTFGTEMQVMQTEVNRLQQKYKNGDTAVLEIGRELSGTDDETKAFTGAEITNTEGYRYYDKSTLEELGLKDFGQEFLVNVPERMIISLAGFNYKGETIFTMSQLSNGAYNVEFEGIQSETTFDLDVVDQELIITNIQYSGNIKNGTIYYGQGETEDAVNWRIAENNTTETSCKIEVKEQGVWYVKIVDSAGNESEIKSVRVVTDANN